MMTQKTFEGRVGLQQRVLPSYRVPFFDELAGRCEGGLSLFSGEPRPGEAILSGTALSIAVHRKAKNRHLWSGAAYLCYQQGLLTWLEDWDPDVLVLEANPRYLSNRMALRWMKVRHRPVIGWALGAPPMYGVLSAPRKMIRRRYVQRFDAMITYSNVGAAQYRAEGFPKDRVFPAYNAVAPAPGSLLERTSAINRPAEVLFVGRLQERKRIDLLIQACAAQRTFARLTIVGDGPARTGLEAIASSVLPDARFVGAQEGVALRRYFEEADLFVLPGTGGLAIQEAMSYGLPVIVAEGDGTQRDLVEAENGWLVTPGDLSMLTETLSNALSEPERLLAMGKHSHYLASTRFNIGSMADTFASVLTKLVGERS